MKNGNYQSLRLYYQTLLALSKVNYSKVVLLSAYPHCESCPLEGNTRLDELGCLSVNVNKSFWSLSMDVELKQVSI
jgi:hypothetical protein